ncbi:TetR family transcriptional regulator [Amycolatopsis sp. PS_44_ISF1]|uniref:TetR/AcrR family transcriptional regulator n=1 Tax=Amycolatopsis sp. PS_44_ISF1 TaxID=2974917 RepID=UPI0028DE31C5|nr:TetR family transcriptional regulator [Amycolatopsis sp. PS_44_ISF1]MDT8914968.1 TetR family transcriptional regulator [Amycolatopsis sp. PS_44_ISF1]
MSGREELIQAALRRARDEGFGALSVRGVAREAGVGATTLRHYFPSQAALHHAVATALVTTVLDDLAIEDDTADPATRLYDCLDQFLPDRAAATESWFDLYCTALAPDAAPSLRNVLHGAHAASATAVRRWLSILAAQGHLAGQDIDDQVAYVLAMINGMQLGMVVEPDRHDLSRDRRLLRWYTRKLLPA